MTTKPKSKNNPDLLGSDITVLNSIVACRLETHKPPLSQRLEQTREQIVSDHGATSSSIKAPAAKLFATSGSPISEAHNIINGMSLFLRDHKRGLPTGFKGTTYHRAVHVDEIQAEFDKRERQLRVCLRKIESGFDALRDQGRSLIAGFANEVEWPTPSAFVADYTFKLHWLSAPSAIGDDVLSGVTSEVRARIVASSQESSRRDLLNAHAAPVRDVIDFLVESIEQIRHGKRLRQERFDRIAAAADTLADCNWLNLPELNRVVAQLKPCAVLDAPSMTKEERGEAADRIEEARRVAVKTLSDLGI